MHLNNSFKESLEFARLMQNEPEVRDACKALIGLRYFLEKNGASEGFEAMMAGFKITSDY